MSWRHFQSTLKTSWTCVRVVVRSLSTVRQWSRQRLQGSEAAIYTGRCPRRIRSAACSGHEHPLFCYGTVGLEDTEGSAVQVHRHPTRSGRRSRLVALFTREIHGYGHLEQYCREPRSPPPMRRAGGFAKQQLRLYESYYRDNLSTLSTSHSNRPQLQANGTVSTFKKSSALFPLKHALQYAPQ
jgi:hypothetical protein